VVARLLSWKKDAVEGAGYDRDELTIFIARADIREACDVLKSDAGLQFRFLSDITCSDWFPNEPRFHLAYHLLSHALKERVRLKVKVSGDDASIDSLMPIWPAANFFEREIFDLFGVRFNEHPYLRRIMMPENWDGHPLRRDYPVEGYR